MNNKFFHTILTDAAPNPSWWISNLDWIFDDEKFDKSLGWSKGPRRALTNYIMKNIKNFSIIEKGKIITPLKDCSYAFFTSNGCACVSFMKHIRNAIAHNHAKIVILKKQKFICFEDYSNSNHKEKTADIMINIDFLIKIQQKYISLKNTPARYIPDTENIAA